MHYTLFKRSFDIIIGMLSLIILSLVILLITVIEFICFGCPVLFIQNRTGYKGVNFKLYKFRTMDGNKNKFGQLLADDERLTKLGKFFRSTSLDELPELFNVIKGDMSLVGPRPLLPEYLPLYTKEQNQRHEVKPGITGWAQVNGRNAITWEEKFKLDVWYVDHQSFCLDLKILFLTIFKVFKREGISQNGHATIEKFKGSST